MKAADGRVILGAAEHLGLFGVGEVPGRGARPRDELRVEGHDCLASIDIIVYVN